MVLIESMYYLLLYPHNFGVLFYIADYNQSNILASAQLV